jgi:DNA excision repair protein ERCC-6
MPSSPSDSESAPSANSNEFIAAHVPQLELEARVLAELDESSKKRQPNGLAALDEATLDAKQKRKFDHLKAKISKADSKAKRAKADPDAAATSAEFGADSSPGSVDFVNIRSYPGLRVRRTLYEYMYPFQREGLEFLARQFARDSGGLLAHDLGLGKTLQTVAFLGSLLESRLLRRILVVCPATLVTQWVKTFNDQFSDLFRAVAGLTDQEDVAAVVVASYETVRAKDALYISAGFGAIVADEAQRLRNPFSQTTTVLKNFRTPLRIALSGTPIQNNLQELWSIMDFVRPGVLGTLAVFNEELAKPVELGCRPNASFKDAQRAYRAALLITQLVDPFMHKKSKYDVDVQRLIQLPEKHEQVLFVHLDFWQYTLYCDFLARTVGGIGDSRSRIRNGSGRLPPQEAGRLFRTIATLRKLANHADLVQTASANDGTGQGRSSGKMQVLLRLLREWRRQEERVLVFSQSLKMLDKIAAALASEGFAFARVDGSTPMGERERVIAEFGPQDDHPRSGSRQVLLVTTKVMGVGTNLQGASRVVIVCPSWNVADDAQARERSWRIGQKKPVEIYRLISSGTIEEIVYKRQIYKQHLSQKILLDPRQQGTDLFSDLKNDLFKIPPAPPGYDEWRKSNTILIDDELRKLHHHAEEAEEDEEDDDDITKLLTDEDPSNPNNTKHHAFVAAVWNQRDVETPLLHHGLLDHDQLNAIDAKATQAIRDSVRLLQPVAATTLPPQQTTGPLAAVGRSRALLAAMAAPTGQDADAEMAHEIRSWFQSRRDFRATSDELLVHFSSKIPPSKQLLFRACLKQLCHLSHGVWTLTNNPNQ